MPDTGAKKGSGKAKKDERKDKDGGATSLKKKKPAGSKKSTSLKDRTKAE